MYFFTQFSCLPGTHNFEETVSGSRRTNLHQPLGTKEFRTSVTSHPNWSTETVGDRPKFRVMMNTTRHWDPLNRSRDSDKRTIIFHGRNTRTPNSHDYVSVVDIVTNRIFSINFCKVIYHLTSLTHWTDFHTSIPHSLSLRSESNLRSKTYSEEGRDDGECPLNHQDHLYSNHKVKWRVTLRGSQVTE